MDHRRLTQLGTLSRELGPPIALLSLLRLIDQMIPPTRRRRAARSERNFGTWQATPGIVAAGFETVEAAKRSCGSTLSPSSIAVSSIKRCRYLRAEGPNGGDLP